MNAHAERFNRTLQEEYIDYHEDELLDPEQFNVGLMQHLLWHNTERPHWSLKMKPPVQFIQDNFSRPECNMYVADTRAICLRPDNNWLADNRCSDEDIATGYSEPPIYRRFRRV